MSDTSLTVVTQTMLKELRRCPMRVYWRTIREIAPLERDADLYFGTFIHACQEIWHETHDMGAVQEHIDWECSLRSENPDINTMWHKATAMMLGYAMQWPADDFTITACEQSFEVPIVNPESGRPSRSFVLAGKIDRIAEYQGETWLLEFKTASNIDEVYLDKLSNDFQSRVYKVGYARHTGQAVGGVIYDVAEKSRLVQSQGETEEEFEVRYAELCAKNKSGKSTATRKLPGSDADYQARLREQYTDPAKFYRGYLYFSADKIREVEAEIWMLTQQFAAMRRHDWFFKNDDSCFQWNKRCPYYRLCHCNDPEPLIALYYEYKPAHAELQDTGNEAISASSPANTALERM
ncbi:MAG TPA: PD-(D/E)XK nuclease family protein [Armatimonadota bacterium]|jgi:RecB family exonuclease